MRDTSYPCTFCKNIITVDEACINIGKEAISKDVNYFVENQLYNPFFWLAELYKYPEKHPDDIVIFSAEEFMKKIDEGN